MTIDPENFPDLFKDDRPPPSVRPFVDIPGQNENFQDKARRIVHDHVNDRLEKTDIHVRVLASDVYVVWFCKALGNWKCLISTTLPDQMYYEVTYDGDKKVTYLDAYKKWENVEIPDE